MNKQGKRETGRVECYILGCFEVNRLKPVSNATPQSQHVIYPSIQLVHADCQFVTALLQFGLERPSPSALEACESVPSVIGQHIIFTVIIITTCHQLSEEIAMLAEFFIKHTNVHKGCVSVGRGRAFLSSHYVCR